MKLTKRRWFGVALICLSIFAVAIIQFSTDELATFHWGPFRNVGSEMDKSGSFTAFESSGVIDVNGEFLIPILAGFGVGFFCLIWPESKPKKQPQNSN